MSDRPTYQREHSEAMNAVRKETDASINGMRHAFSDGYAALEDVARALEALRDELRVFEKESLEVPHVN